MPFIIFLMVSPGTGKSGSYPSNQRKGLAAVGWNMWWCICPFEEQTQSLGCSAECSGYWMHLWQQPPSLFLFFLSQCCPITAGYQLSFVLQMRDLAAFLGILLVLVAPSVLLLHVVSKTQQPWRSAVSFNECRKGVSMMHTKIFLNYSPFCIAFCVN